MRKFAPLTIAKLADAVQCWWSVTDYQGQKCRFCGKTPRAAGHGWELWKYGVRHYACGLCRREAMRG